MKPEEQNDTPEFDEEEREDMLEDDEITNLEGYIVATNDKELKRRLKKKGVKLISLVNKSKYIIT